MSSVNITIYHLFCTLRIAKDDNVQVTVVGHCEDNSSNNNEIIEDCQTSVSGAESGAAMHNTESSVMVGQDLIAKASSVSLIQPSCGKKRNGQNLSSLDSAKPPSGGAKNQLCSAVKLNGLKYRNGCKCLRQRTECCRVLVRPLPSDIRSCPLNTALSHDMRITRKQNACLQSLEEHGDIDSSETPNTAADQILKAANSKPFCVPSSKPQCARKSSSISCGVEPKGKALDSAATPLQKVSSPFPVDGVTFRVSASSLESDSNCSRSIDCQAKTSVSVCVPSTKSLFIDQRNCSFSKPYQDDQDSTTDTSNDGSLFWNTFQSQYCPVSRLVAHRRSSDDLLQRNRPAATATTSLSHSASLTAISTLAQRTNRSESSGSCNSGTTTPVTKSICKWDKCWLEVQPSDLKDHIHKHHIQSQSGEMFVCLWDGCKVYDKPSCNLAWLERHVLSHSGDKPFACIVENCGQRFSSQFLLERHVNGHFSASGPQAQQRNRAKDDGTPSKLKKKKGKGRKRPLPSKLKQQKKVMPGLDVCTSSRNK